MNSYIGTGAGHTSFVGADAVRLFQATALRAAINIYIETSMLTSRNATPIRMREAASRITGKVYARNGLAKASVDLTIWIDTMKAALPIVSEGSNR